MDVNSTQNHNHHAIILPFSLQGHVNPAVQLSLNLAARGFTITFLIIEHVHQRITQASGNQSDDIFEAACRGSSHIDIRYQIVSDGLPLDIDRSVRMMEYRLEWLLHGGFYDQLEKAIESIVLKSRPKVNVLIVDTFYPWASKIAKKFGLRCASFWTEPALVFNLYYHTHLLRENGHFDCHDTRKDPIDYIPGVKSIEPKDIMSYLQEKDTSTPMHKLVFKAYEDVRSFDFVLCNTVQELELETISTLQALMPFYPIGPILLPDSTKTVVPTSFCAEVNCLEWLKDKSDGSILYISFGSLANFNKNVVLEIAHGLMDSQVDFIWVLRPSMILDESNDMLPLGFEESVHGRGIIVPWINQIEVLSHRAIGGFLTHCGWNSILESIWCHVPMLCFPVFGDQFTNRKLVVDDWKIGINLCNGNAVGNSVCNGSVILRDEISAQIKKFMDKKLKDCLKNKISDVRHIFRSALEVGGSAERHVTQFIEQLSNFEET